MSYTPNFRLGKWKCVCQLCGRIFKSDEVRRRWDGLMVCEEDWESKHPQLSVQANPDNQSVPFKFRTDPVYVDCPYYVEANTDAGETGQYWAKDGDVWNWMFTDDSYSTRSGV